MLQEEMNGFTRPKEIAFLKDDKLEKKAGIKTVLHGFHLAQSRGPLRYNNRRTHVKLGVILT